MWADPIADMLTRVRNATRIRRRQVTIPLSKMKVGIAKVLQDEGYIERFDTIEDNKQGLLRIDLKYGQRGEKILNCIERVSKPGCRVYRGVEEFPEVLDGLGISILSTSKGILSDRAAREQKVGGELLCTVY